MNARLVGAFPPGSRYQFGVFIEQSEYLYQRKVRHRPVSYRENALGPRPKNRSASLYVSTSFLRTVAIDFAIYQLRVDLLHECRHLSDTWTPSSPPSPRPASSSTSRTGCTNPRRLSDDDHSVFKGVRQILGIGHELVRSRDARIMFFTPRITYLGACILFAL